MTTVREDLEQRARFGRLAAGAWNGMNGVSDLLEGAGTFARKVDPAGDLNAQIDRAGELIDEAMKIMRPLCCEKTLASLQGDEDPDQDDDDDSE